MSLYCLIMGYARSKEVRLPSDGQQRGRDPPADSATGGPAAPLRVPSRDSAAANIWSSSGHQRGRQDHHEVVLFHPRPLRTTTDAMRGTKEKLFAASSGGFALSLRILFIPLGLVRGGLRMVHVPLHALVLAATFSQVRAASRPISYPLGQNTLSSAVRPYATLM